MYMYLYKKKFDMKRQSLFTLTTLSSKKGDKKVGTGMGMVRGEGSFVGYYDRKMILWDGNF